MSRLTYTHLYVVQCGERLVEENKWNRLQMQGD